MQPSTAQPAKDSALDILAEPLPGCQCLLARSARLVGLDVSGRDEGIGAIDGDLSGHRASNKQKGENHEVGFHRVSPLPDSRPGLAPILAMSMRPTDVRSPRPASVEHVRQL